MKHLVILLSITFGLSAHAELKIGDSARYIVGMQGQAYELTEVVTSVNSAADQFTDKQTIYQNGNQIQQSSETSKISDNDQSEGMFDVCLQLPANLNPRYESITVAAGSFNTCHLTQTDPNGAVLNAWFAKVVFGVVKMVKEHSIDNSDISFELKTFKKM